MSKNVSSILTTAMQNAAEAKEADDITENADNDVFTIRIPKRVIKKAAIGALIGGAVSYFAIRAARVNVDEENETDSED